MQLNFDATQVAPSQPLEVIPADWYVGAIVESEMTPTKDGTGSYLTVVEQILDGPFKGRKQFARFNLNNKNQQAVDIAYRDLSALCHAVGVLRVDDSKQLHNIPHEFKVAVKPAEGQYGEGNEVRGFRAVNSGAKPAGNGVGAAGHAAQAGGAPSFASAASNPAGQQLPWQQQPQQAAPSPGVAGSAPPWQQQPTQQAPQQFAQQAPTQQPWQQQAAPVQAIDRPAPGQPVAQYNQQAGQQTMQPYTPPWQQQPQQAAPSPGVGQQPQQGGNSAVPPWQR